MLKLFILLFTSGLIYSCTYSNESKELNRDLTFTPAYKYPVLDLTSKQQSAFDALNKIQTSTDEKNRLYSTYSNIKQPCYPPDTSFEILQSELQYFMLQFVEKYCRNMDPEIRDQLAKSSVLAQEKYTVLHCIGNKSIKNDHNGFPMHGTWVIPGILGHRDVLITW